jgi:formylglycine-generating enzyme required for sulfatase activity
MSSIFLSHSSQDNGIAGHVKVRLEQCGHRSVFLDFDPEHGIPAGRDWEKELYAKLRECRAVIILCSHTSMASRWFFAEITHAKALGKPVFPIKIDDAQVDRILTSAQVIDATAGWDAAYQRLEKGLLAAGLDPKDLFIWDNGRPPYPGLSAFQEQDAAIFFGRDKEIREGQALLNRLQQFGGPRLTLMLGASGSGKSSLMRAGLVPRLKRDPRWVVVEPFRPLRTPFDQSARIFSKRFSQVTEVEKGTPTDVAHVRDRIRWEEDQAVQSADTFLELLKELRESVGSREATVLLMIDQCEELLAGGANEEGDRFLAFLRAVLDREDSCLMVLATLRSDFLGSFQEHPTMRGLRVEPFTVPQMAVDDFATVIEDPARIAGLELGPGLVQAMIGDTKTSDALPLLAFTLRELYEGFGEDKLRLTLEEYRDKLGRLEGCIARAAEAVLTAKPLSEEKLSALRTSFLSMVRVADNDQYAKQPVLWNDLPASIHDVLERFVTARLLISGGDKNGRTLEVAHEALFRAWPRLVSWLEDNKSFLVWQQRLNAMRKEWEASERSADLLLRGLPLTEAMDWFKKKSDDLSPVEREFVTASMNRKKRNRMAAATIAGLVFILIGALSWSWKEGVTVKYTVSIVKARLHLVSVLEPEMVEIPGGDFLQGDVITRPNNPLRKVTVNGFMIGKYEVTFEEYDRYVELTGGRSPNDETLGRQRRPVTGVMWEDAVDYAKWLFQATGKRYRLPTESEWEYAAGSGGKHTVWAGTSDENQLNDFAVYTVNSNQVEPVGSKKPNGFGLYDMSGNLWELVGDCFAKAGKECGFHMLRGGSRGNKPKQLRVSYQHPSNVGTWGNFMGFRLAQDIP